MRIKLERGIAIAGLPIALAICQSANATIVLDRWYEMGDLPRENAVIGNYLGQNLTGDEEFTTLNTIDSPSAANPINSPAPGDDLLQLGDPVYVDASDRPYAAPGNLAAYFSGDPEAGQTMAAANWYPRDALTSALYGGTFRLGFQGWVKPDGAKQHVRQDIMINGGFAMYIAPDVDNPDTEVDESQTDNWWVVYSNDAGNNTHVPVVYDEWHHLAYWTIGNFATTWLDGSYLWNRGGFYGGSGGQYFSFGSNLAATDNFYAGAIDDVKAFTGNFVNSDIDAIALALDGKRDADVNLDGVVNQDDIDTFVANWGYTGGQAAATYGTIYVGGLASRMLGDVNVDGLINLFDWDRIRTDIIANGYSAPDISAIVPEPASLGLLAVGLGLMGRRRSRATRNAK